MYTHTNFPSKKALKEAVAAGQRVTYYQPGPFPFGGNEPKTGWIFLEGPHYPKPPRWHAHAYAKDGQIVKVK